ncbi:MAG: DUF5939 domain-containing protein [Myxococcota bacterium]
MTRFSSPARWRRSTFTVSPSVRRIGAHDPDTLPFWQYHQAVAGPMSKRALLKGIAAEPTVYEIP